MERQPPFFKRTGAKPARPVRTQILTWILPVVAMCVSLYSLWSSIRTGRDVARIDAVKTQYGLFQSMARARMDQPLMSHMFAETGEAYDLQSELIRSVTHSATEREISELLLRESALAHYIFTSFEEAYYLNKNVKEGEAARATFTDDNLAFFTTYLCANPRLRWYWDRKGGKLALTFAPELRDYYRDSVLKECGSDAPPDAHGPFHRASGGAAPLHQNPPKGAVRE
jgi:hypothetical protein